MVQAALPQGVHGGAADLRAGLQRQGGGVHRRVPHPGHRTAAPGRQRVGRGFHRGGRRASVRSGGGEGRGPGVHQPPAGGARQRRPVSRFRPVLRPDVRHGAEPPGTGKSHQVRRVRPYGIPALPASGGLWAGAGRRGRQPQAQCGGPDRPVRRLRGRRASEPAHAASARHPGGERPGENGDGKGDHRTVSVRPPHGRVPGERQNDGGRFHRVGAERLWPGGRAEAVL